MVLAKPRDRILSTATTLFAREGILTVGVNRVIAEADVAPMTLYRQFGGKDQLVAAALEQWSAQWLHWLADRLDRAGDDPETRFAALWDGLDAWFARDDFCGSFVASAAAELRSEPQHPGHKVIAAHRSAMRQLLEDLTKAAGVHDPAILAAQLQVLVDGAVAAAAVDGPSGSARTARQLANAALAASSS